ncbi:MAG: 16S rRNA (adenine(1518)-N(6)/adenine(1519)-N(6))-dimethyltransferase RsmA [Acidimicrobiia bacterium]|nr:16S rRNA (adenine(1518)-N(6)/adenine(1519)-N(6))-dimethyltransferase RsmA [Acidimicrobiia bacterium]
MKLLGGREVRDLVTAAGVRPSKHRGQNFLCDPNVVRRIVALAAVVPGERVLEVGVGVGSLTAGLAGAGADVLGVEVDARLAKAAGAVVPDAQIVVSDAAGLDWREVLGAAPPAKMVSNLPYAVGTSVLVDLLDDVAAMSVFVVMVQREVGERLCAGPGDAAYGAVSVKVHYHGTARLEGRVPPSVFWPRPEVDSVLVRIDRHPQPPVDVAPGLLFDVVKAAFGQRRKTVRNALASGWSVEQVDAALAAAGVDSRARAETLGLDDLAALATELGK